MRFYVILYSTQISNGTSQVQGTQIAVFIIVRVTLIS